MPDNDRTPLEEAMERTKKNRRPRKRAALAQRNLIETHRLENSIGVVRLSADGFRAMRKAQLVYGGETYSYTTDRIFRGINIKKVPVVFTVDADVYYRIEAKAKERGYECAEDLIAASIVASFGGRVGS